jgi:hypothetical protein
VPGVRKGFALRLTLAGLAALTTLGLVAPGASASFHLMSIREIATDPAGANSSYIELQMYSAGQNFVNTHKVNFYTASGGVLASFTLNKDVANGDNQRTILIGDTATAGTPDFVYDQLGDALLTFGPGGAACWDTLDCVSWGTFNNTSGTPLPSPTGPNAPAIPLGSSLERSIAPGCATLLEAGDDTNNSATDFAVATPSPRNNSVTPTETACGGGGGGGGGGDTDAPDTTITKAPKAKSTKAKAKFKFTSNEQGSTFQCKFDKGPFEDCSSPRTYKNLKPGKHKFKVKATDAAGNTDQTPAKAKFKVLEG